MGNIYSLFIDNTTADECGGDARDPRSPLRSRTPLALRLTSSKKRRAAAALACADTLADPRSPTLAFRRTPLVACAVDYCDPRSPMAGRTPVRRLQFDVQDPREPDRVRTPLASSFVGVPSMALHVAAPRRLACDDSVHSAFDDDESDVEHDQQTAHDESMNSFEDELLLDSESVDDDFEEVDLDASPLPMAMHERLADGDWAAQLSAKKPTMRYTLLSPKQRGTPRLSLCAGRVRTAIERAVQSARISRHVPMTATCAEAPIAALLLRPDDSDDDNNDGKKATYATPPSPFAVLAAAGMSCYPRIQGGLRLASSCPSSPAA